MRVPPTRPVSAQEPPVFETTAFKRFDDLLFGRSFYVILCKEAPPTDSDWSYYMADVEAAAAKHPENLAGLTTLVLSDGGAPNAMQRTRITKLQEGTTARSAVAFISDSPLVRGATGAVALFNPKLKVFTPGTFSKALEYLDKRLPLSAAVVKRHILETAQLLGGERLRVVRAIFARSGAQ
jgi:hypothetical protein